MIRREVYEEGFNDGERFALSLKSTLQLLSPTKSATLILSSFKKEFEDKKKTLRPKFALAFNKREDGDTLFEWYYKGAKNGITSKIKNLGIVKRAGHMIDKERIRPTTLRGVRPRTVRRLK